MSRHNLLDDLIADDVHKVPVSDSYSEARFSDRVFSMTCLPVLWSEGRQFLCNFSPTFHPGILYSLRLMGVRTIVSVTWMSFGSNQGPGSLRGELSVGWTGWTECIPS